MAEAKAPNSYSPNAVITPRFRAGPVGKRFFSKRRIYCQSLETPEGRRRAGATWAMGEITFSLRQTT